MSREIDTHENHTEPTPWNHIISNGTSLLWPDTGVPLPWVTRVYKSRLPRRLQRIGRFIRLRCQSNNNSVSLTYNVTSN